MSFLNSGIDVTSFMGDSFDTGMAVNARNKANAYMKGSAAKRAGDLAGQGLGLFGKFKGQDLLADAGAYEQQQQQKAGMFGTVMNLVGGIGGSAAMGSGTNPYSGDGGGFGISSDSLAIGSPSSFGGGKLYDIDFTKIY